MTNVPRLLLLSSLLLGTTSIACGGDDDDHHEGEEPALAEAEALLADVQADDYRSFDRMRGWDLPHAEATTPHHGAFIDIYINDTLAGALEAGPPFPEGSIVVKDGWRDAEGTDPFGIAIMRKDADGWFWAEYGSSGTPTEAGKDVDECLECHSGGTDNLLTF